MSGAPLDVARARAETPGCVGVTYVDNVGSALPPQAVSDGKGCPTGSSPFRSICVARSGPLPTVTVHDLGRRRSAIVTFAVAGLDADEVAGRLRAEDVNVSVSRAAPARFDLPTRGLDSLARASVRYYNTDEELDRLVGLSERSAHSASSGAVR